MFELADRLLREAGWVPGRTRPVTEDLTVLRDGGYPAGGRLEEFVREYGELIVTYVRNGREDHAVLDVRKGCERADPDWVGEYSERAGTPLSPIGYANHEHLLLLAGEDGKFFGGFDDFLGYLGGCVAEMVERLATRGIESIVRSPCGPSEHNCAL